MANFVTEFQSLQNELQKLQTFEKVQNVRLAEIRRLKNEKPNFVENLIFHAKLGKMGKLVQNRVKLRKLTTAVSTSQRRIRLEVAETKKKFQVFAEKLGNELNEVDEKLNIVSQLMNDFRALTKKESSHIFKQKIQGFTPPYIKRFSTKNDFHQTISVYWNFMLKFEVSCNFENEIERQIQELLCDSNWRQHGKQVRSLAAESKKIRKEIREEYSHKILELTEIKRNIEHQWIKANSNFQGIVQLAEDFNSALDNVFRKV